MLFSKKKRTIYFPGCVTSYVNKEHIQNWKAILTDLGIEFNILTDISCCGSPAYTAGYFSDFRDVVAQNLKKLKDVKEIISNCPHCVYVFERFYKIKAKHTSQILYQNKEKIQEKTGIVQEVSYHDPCTLSRKLSITKSPREAIEAAGYELKEFKKNKARTLCCGASGGLIYSQPALAKKIAKNRLESAPSKIVVVACPLCYYHFQQAATKSTTILELSELFLD